MHKIIRLPEVINVTGLARSTVYKKVADKSFPSPISLGSKSVGWLEANVQDWIQQQIARSSTHLDR